jgi:hypothetical protein
LGKAKVGKHGCAFAPVIHDLPAAGFNNALDVGEKGDNYTIVHWNK